MRTNQKVLFSFVLLLSFKLQAQLPDTDIWLFDLSDEKGKFTLSHPVNISDRDGYDNQPVFSPDGKYILYTSYRKNGQSDIMKYEIETKNTKAFCHTMESEYSPAYTPDGKFVSVVRVELDSVQRLWKFPVEGGRPELVLKEVPKVAYYSWINSDSLLVFLLTQPMSLNLVTTKNQKPILLEENPGRVIYTEGGGEYLSVTKIDTGKWLIQQKEYIKRGHLLCKENFQIETFKGVEDFAFFDHCIFMGNQSKLYYFNTLPKDGSPATGWILIKDLSKTGLKNITRMAISKDGKKIALVSTK